MPDCKHESLKVETLFENEGKENQRRFSFVRCILCGNIFPIQPELKNSTDYHLKNITEQLKYIQQDFCKIKDKIK